MVPVLQCFDHSVFEQQRHRAVVGRKGAGVEPDGDGDELAFAQDFEVKRVSRLQITDCECKFGGGADLQVRASTTPRITSPDLRDRTAEAGHARGHRDAIDAAQVGLEVKRTVGVLGQARLRLIPRFGRVDLGVFLQFADPRLLNLDPQEAVGPAGAIGIAAEKDLGDDVRQGGRLGRRERLDFATTVFRAARSSAAGR